MLRNFLVPALHACLPKDLNTPPPPQQITKVCVNNIRYIIRLPTNASVLC